MYLCVPMCVYVDQYSLYQFFSSLIIITFFVHEKDTRKNKQNKTKKYKCSMKYLISVYSLIESLVNLAHSKLQT
jgi:hypothetical protein